MKNRIVKLIYPKKSSDKVLVSVSALPSKRSGDSVYTAVDFFRNEIFAKSEIRTYDEEIIDRMLLRNIVSLHNDTGIKDTSQIKSMVQQIKSGKDILSPDGLPNIKLVKTERSEWVLFDGHHSILAYMLAGKRYLDELPHLIVGDEKGVYVSDEEIHVFFGRHKNKLKNKDWRKYVINWQAQEENQVQERIQRNMGEVLDSLCENGFWFY